MPKTRKLIAGHHKDQRSSQDQRQGSMRVFNSLCRKTENYCSKKEGTFPGEEKKEMKSKEIIRIEELRSHDIPQLFDSSSEENEIAPGNSSKILSETFLKKGKNNKKKHFKHCIN